MNNAAVAFVVGHVSPGTPGPEIFEELSINHGLKFLPEHEPGMPFELLPRDVLRQLDRSPGLGTAKALFLLCLERGDSHIANAIQQLKTRRSHAKVVVYADEAHDSGALAMECVLANNGVGACDFLVRGHPLAQIKGHVFQLLGERDIFAHFQRKPILKSGTINRAFIATPYDVPALTDCYSGIFPAVEALGMKPFLSSAEIASESILQKIREHIDDSRLVIVNLSQYQGLHPNPNVYFELGYAVGRNLPVVLVQRTGDAGVPVNLAGAELLKYSSQSDLAMQLYFGLK